MPQAEVRGVCTLALPSAWAQALTQLSQHDTRRNARGSPTESATPVARFVMELIAPQGIL